MKVNKRFGICLPTSDPNQPSADYGTMIEITHCEDIPGSETIDTRDGSLPRYLIETKGVFRFRIHSQRFDPCGYIVADVERLEDEDIEVLVNSASRASSENLSLDCISDAFLSTLQSSVNSSDVLEECFKFIDDVKDRVASDLEFPRRLKDMEDLLRRHINNLSASLHPHALNAIYAQYGTMPENLSDLTFWIAEILPFPMEQKYSLLALNSVFERVRSILSWIRASRCLSKCAQRESSSLINPTCHGS